MRTAHPTGGRLLSDSPELPPRPAPPRRLVDTASAWLAWFGPGRLILSAVCVGVVVVGLAWLVRAPAPSTESGLPFATVAAGASASTLPPPAAGTTGGTPPTTEVAATIASHAVVHVAGAVVRPGVYQLDADARVDTAIDMAGGPTVDADLDGLNLAATLGDGQRIYVPELGEVDPAAVPSGAPIVVPGVTVVTSPSGPIDVNTATAVELQTLPGVGPATAAAIVDDRERNGPFASVADLERVPGIGPAKLAAIADSVTV